MLNNLLQLEATIGETAIYALIGFLVVFGGIAFLIFIVWLIGRAMAYLKGEPVFAKAVKTAAPKKETSVVAPAAQEMAVASSDEVSEETLAVITAALMAYYKQAKPECGFIVKRIKRI